MLLNLLQCIKLQKRHKCGGERGKKKDWHSNFRVLAHLAGRVELAEGHKEQILVIPALPVKLLMALRRGMLCPKVSTALRGDQQWPGLPHFGRAEMLCPHPVVKLSSVYWRAAIPGWRQNFTSFPWYLIHWDPKVAHCSSGLSCQAVVSY